MGFFTAHSDGSYTVSAACYTLNITGHRIAVQIENTTFAVLDVRSAVPATLEDNSGFLPDPEPTLPELTSVSPAGGRIEFTWKGKSALWGKTYRLVCDHLRFTFHVTLEGQGRVDAVRYFSGDMGDSSGAASYYEFSEGFTPCISWYNHEDYTFRASVDCHRWSVLMVPPMFCYAFRCEGLTRRMGLGLAARPGEHNFHSFDYHVSANGFVNGFWLETDQAGHVSVDGSWEAPHIVGFSGDDQWDILRQYSEYYFTAGLAQPKSTAPAPRFWYGPMVCGWIEQAAIAYQEGRDIMSLACEPVYESLMDRVRQLDLTPRAVIVDDKWQAHYATASADPAKFPDMRAFSDRRRAEGLHTLLWFKLWDADGWDGALMYNSEGKAFADPSHPAFRQNLADAIHRLLSADEGCYNCDGFKLDYAFENPIGRDVKTYSGKYGVELLYDLMADIYRLAKAEKPEALVNCSPCHPYFAHLCDQARLHDYDSRNRDNREDLTMRARLFSTAMPGVLLDTDNAGFSSHRDTMRWLLNQPAVGVPDLYSLRSNASCTLTEDDFAALAQLWHEYNDRMDALYGKDPILN